MRYIEIPETRKIQGEDAIQALKNYIKELEEEKGDNELSPKQTRAMIKFASGLVSSIEAEVKTRQPKINDKPKRLVDVLREAIAKSVGENKRVLRRTTTANGLSASSDHNPNDTNAALDAIQERNIPK